MIKRRTTAALIDGVRAGRGASFSRHFSPISRKQFLQRAAFFGEYPRYSGTTFVLLHGGYPFDRASTWLAARRNVYIDSSLLDLLLYPAELSRVLRHWLETYPDKIVFGSDAFPFNEVLGVEESYWLGVHSVRSALALALAEMIAARQIDEKQALAMAQGYLHDNAASLYARLRAGH